MPEKGIKKHEGKTKERSVLALTPVQYSITIQYLGEDYVERDKNKYRCQYILKKDSGESMETLPQRIPNVVSGLIVNGVDENAAKPQGGLNNPSTDQVYRLLVTDNHTLPENDARLLGNTGNPNGDTVSRPDYYKRDNRKWIKDVQPAAPFRVIVRKFQGFAGNEEQVDLDETLKVVIEVKDPKEETGVHAAVDSVQRCLEDFFKKYNREDNDPDEGDDNCLEWFRGHRKPSDARPGVKATTVIKSSPYIKPPTPDTATAETLKFNNLSSKWAYKKMWVKLDVQAEKLNDAGKEIKIGISDFVFNPLPIGGDNYRFLIWLVNKSGKDIRDTKINGAEIDILDDQKNIIPKPRAYCTGRFVIWRKVDVRLLLCVNGLAKGDINWDTVKGYYNHTFTEITPPGDDDKIDLPLAGWRQSIINVLNNGNETGAYANMDNFRPAGKTEADAEYNDIYQQGLIPAFVPDAKKTKENVKLICKDILNNAVKALPPPPPLEGPHETPADRNTKGNGAGLNVLYVKDNVSSLLGVWLGDGRLMVCEHTGAYAAELNETTAHEMAHGFFLRHANTSTQRSWWNSTEGDYVNCTVEYHPSAGASKTIALINPRSNCFPEDHDQYYSSKCTMSYLQDEQFCGICALSLRFSDRVKIQDQKRFQNRIMEGYFLDDPGDDDANAKIVYIEYDNADPNKLKLKETIPSVAHGETIYLMAVSPERQYIAAGVNTDGRINISCVHKKPDTLWKSSSTRILSVESYLDLRAKVTTSRAGTATVTYSRNGKSVSVDITVT